MHISPYHQEVFLCHGLLREMSILGKVLSKVAAIQNLCQQQLSSLFIHWHNHHILFQSQHLIQYIHHRPSELPQAKIFLLSLQCEAPFFTLHLISVYSSNNRDNRSHSYRFKTTGLSFVQCKRSL